MDVMVNPQRYIGMSWRYVEPQRCDYDSEEEYEDAMDAYQNALDDYCDWVEERRR